MYSTYNLIQNDNDQNLFFFFFKSYFIIDLKTKPVLNGYMTDMSTIASENKFKELGPNSVLVKSKSSKIFLK